MKRLLLLCIRTAIHNIITLRQMQFVFDTSFCMSFIALPKSRFSNRAVTTPMFCMSSRCISASPELTSHSPMSQLVLIDRSVKRSATVSFQSKLHVRLLGYNMRMLLNCFGSYTLPTTLPSNAVCNWYCRVVWRNAILRKVYAVGLNVDGRDRQW